ncbi:MAG: arginine--tRNA ligase, partial [Proteobacteria bacterium]|nr:arginine--tRNA ligase [Pseudomonadota bacterium]
QDLSEKISISLKDNSNAKLIEYVKAFGPYVNFFLNKEKFYGLIINNSISKKQKKTPSKKHGTVVIDYSSPNIAKPIAFHHIRSAVIGNIIGNIFEHNDYEVIRINYLGDWGTQFGKLITAFENYGDDKKLEREGIKHLLDVYVQYHREENDELNSTAKKWFQLMEAGDKKALSYWKKFRDISIKEFDRVYKRLGVSFTNIEGESFYNGKTESVIKDIDKKIGTKESEGAVIVDLSAFDMPPVLLKKTDGTTLYATRDIAAAIDRWNRFAFVESLYVVGNQQELHFKQVFKTLELMKLDWFSRCKHVQFGLLHFEDAKMSTREGRMIFLEDVLDKSVELAKKAIDEKNPDLKNKDEIAEAIGVGAIIFGDICKKRIQDITFKWEDILNFDGETAPYVQYTHARACSILSKAGFAYEKDMTISKEYLPSDLEFELVKLLSSFEDKLIEAQREYEPFVLARYVLDLCQVFNRYYYQEKIIDIKDEKQKEAKLALVYSVKENIKECLSIMDIKAPERM